MSACTIKINQILDKVRTLSKECNISSLSSKIPSHDNPRFELVLDEYLKALDELRIKFYEYHETVEEYKKLQEVLQKNQTEIRKHVGIEQQLKLYIDTLKGQYEESESDRLELLDNSKAMIKSLKSENERLYGKVKELQSLRIQTKERSSQKKIATHQRVKTEHYLSVYENHRTMPDHDFISPSRKKRNQQLMDFKVELTDRQNKDTSHKKRMFDIKKNKLHNYTILAYSNPQKKRNSKEKNVQKKTLMTLNDTKKTGVTSGFKTHTRSNKKVHKSVFSLPESEADRDFSQRKEFAEHQHRAREAGPNAFYFSPETLRKNN